MLKFILLIWQNTRDIHRIMDVALDKAIKEIIGPVIQRSVTIASRTTKELILKVNDF